MTGKEGACPAVKTALVTRSVEAAHMANILLIEPVERRFAVGACVPYPVRKFFLLACFPRGGK